MKVRFLTLAQQELDDAVAWYNEQAAGLGYDFLDEVDRAVRRTVASLCPARKLNRVCDDACWPDSLTD